MKTLVIVALLVATTTTSASLEGLDELMNWVGIAGVFEKLLDEPFLIWPQSSAGTFPILKEDSDELSVNSTEYSDIELDKATIIFRTGLCGESSSVSIESQLYPGKFWRHQHSVMKLQLHSKDETKHFKEDSCFKISQGDCNNGSFTLESVNYPGYFIQKCDSQMKIRTEKDNCGDVSNKCWVNPVSQQASLAYCSTIVTDEMDVPLHPECCHNVATLEEFGGCCQKIMNDNEDGCYVEPVSNPFRPIQNRVPRLTYCRRSIRTWQDISRYPECCLFPPSRIVEGVNTKCCTDHGICVSKRKKRQQGCPTTCNGLWYCVKEMRVTTKWYVPKPECCCHPFRKNWMLPHNHHKLYNQECMELGHPDVSG